MNLLRKNRNNNRPKIILHSGGYTLLEVLVVLVIITILVLVAFPTMTGFVGSSKKKNADAIAATIYTFADNLLYDDIYLNKSNSYHCKESCFVDSAAPGPSYQKLIDDIQEAYPDEVGRFYLAYIPDAGLQIEYFYANNPNPSNPDGRYPEAITIREPISTTTSTRPVANGTYPKPGSTTVQTTTITTTKQTSSAITTTVITTTNNSGSKTHTYDGWNLLFWFWYWFSDVDKGDIVVYHGVSYELLTNRFLVGLPPYDIVNWKQI